MGSPPLLREPAGYAFSTYKVVDTSSSQRQRIDTRQGDFTAKVSGDAAQANE